MLFLLLSAACMLLSSFSTSLVVLGTDEVGYQYQLGLSTSDNGEYYVCDV